MTNTATPKQLTANQIMQQAIRHPIAVGAPLGECLRLAEGDDAAKQAWHEFTGGIWPNRARYADALDAAHRLGYQIHHGRAADLHAEAG